MLPMLTSLRHLTALIGVRCCVPKTRGGSPSNQPVCGPSVYLYDENAPGSSCKSKENICLIRRQHRSMNSVFSYPREIEHKSATREDLTGSRVRNHAPPIGPWR